MRWIGIVGACCAALVIAAPAPADAAIRYASPTGDASSAATCPQADPCDIQTAVEDASVMGDDEVIVLPGVHDIGSEQLDVGTPSGGTQIDLHGVAGQPRPEIRGTGTVVVLVKASATVSHLAIRAFPAGALSAALFFDANYSPTVERLDVYAEGTDVVACAPPLRPAGTDAVLRDSVCHADGGGSDAGGVATDVSSGAPLTWVAKLVNVTAIGTSGAPGIYLEAISNADLTVNGTNVIARAETGPDVVTIAGDGTTAATINLDHSNYSTESETDSGGSASVTDPGSATNQIASPVFADLAADDFHQVAGSPTIDAGTGADSLLGDFDLDGQARIQGAAVDIGADEFAPPAPPAATCAGRAATHVGTAGADTITGTNGDDVVAALAGNDLIATGPGNDLVCAGPGNDRVFTRAGFDRVFGESGHDRIFGGAARDFLFGQAGFDRLFGGGGSDRAFGGAKLDRLFGGPGFDRLFGQAGHDRAFGNAGRDLLNGAAGRDRLFGGAGVDRILGLGGRPDRCFGGAGRDRGGRGCERRFSLP